MPVNTNDLLTEEAAIRLAGDNVISYETDGAFILLGDTATVIIADPQDRLEVSGVWNSREFHLHGPFTHGVGVRLFGHAPGSPEWRWAGQPSDTRPVHLLTRMPEGCVYLGVGKPRHARYTENGRLTYAKLTMEPELAPDLLDRARPPVEPETLPNLDWLTHMTADPLEALTQFAEGWIPETPQDLGTFAAAPWSVPEPLAVFYRLARHRPALLGVHNQLRPPHEWEQYEDLIAFGDENQGVFTWLFDPASPDPEVWMDDGHELRREHQPISGFLLQFALHETMMNAPYKAVYFGADAEHVDALAAALTPLPWEPWLYDAKRFHIAPGVIAETAEQPHGECQVGALHRGALHPLGQLGIPWTEFDG